MKRYKLNIARFPLLIMGLFILSAFSVGCSRTKDKGESSSDSLAVTTPPSPEVKAGIERVRLSIIHNKPEEFAHEVSYPVQRPYPLRDIKDSTEMKKYYNVMVDDSLRDIVRKTPASEWTGDGWKGWKINDEGYLWYDGEKLYAVDYISELEAQMLDSLQRREIQSLDKSMQPGWLPVTVLKNVKDGTLYRIDRDSMAEMINDGVTVRLAVYPPKSNYHKRPRRLMKGKVRTEGTIGAHIFEFSDSTGLKAQYNDSPTSNEESLDMLMIYPQGDTIVNVVVPTYWLDHL